jgi:hypothetical protein
VREAVVKVVSIVVSCRAPAEQGYTGHDLSPVLITPLGVRAGSSPTAARSTGLPPRRVRGRGSAARAVRRDLPLTAIPPQRILPRQAQHEPLNTGASRRTAGLRRPLVSYFLAASLRCQASSVAGVTGNTSDQRRRGTIRTTTRPSVRQVST